MFVVIELQTNADGTLGNFVWSFQSEAEAMSKYHAVLSAAAVSSLPVHGAVVLRNDGLQLAGQAYKHGEEVDVEVE